jgi:hypothetical protein
MMQQRVCRVQRTVQHPLAARSSPSESCVLQRLRMHSMVHPASSLLFLACPSQGVTGFRALWRCHA